MLQESEDLVSELKANDRYFAGLFEKHKALGLRIGLMESRLESGSPDEIEQLKASRQALRQEIDRLLQSAITSRQR